ncbi:MAG: hypothetical protein IJJ33_12005, partial [Victivallales bacterium]|nr:hypothetical protein [Victivallales bacterium]
TSNKAKYTISLVKPDTGKNALNRDQTFEWKNGEWLCFSFHLPQMLKKAGLDDKTLQELKVTSIGVRRTGTTHNESLQIDDFFIHGLPEKPDQPDILKYVAYDASGVASLDFAAVGKDNANSWKHSFDSQATADLNALRSKIPAEQACQWFRVFVKDKAGNFNEPCWIPVAK